MKRIVHSARLIAFITASLIAGTGARALSAADAPGKLSKTVLPIHYAIDFKPDLERMTLAGSQIVEIDVKAPTGRLVLNAVRMTFASASLDGIGPATVTFDADEETATLTFPRQIEVGRHILRIAFAAQINDDVGGSYRVDYEVGKNRKRMFATHMQPDEARQVFPSWDEPAFKATFEVSVTVPRTFLAVSNTPIAREVPLRGGLKRVSFERTPVMPTYTFGLVAGELERTTLDVDDVTIGVVAAPGNRDRARFALDSTAGLLKFYKNYTGLKYPLAKLDLIAIPGPAGEAHENWGAITFKEEELLLKSTADQNAARKIFLGVAHELAHQWFGNLVTMAWWDHLWLNEGFATWIEAKAAEQLHPNWPSWLFASSNKRSAMDADSGLSAHPVHRQADTKRDMNSMFDVMTYNKGAAVVLMLENYLGEEAFRDGLRHYLATHAYSNTVPANLWQALENASGKPVEALATGYIEQAGIPLVIAEASCVDGRQRIALRQERFVIQYADAPSPHWRVPLAYGSVAGKPWRKSAVLDGKDELDAGTCGEAVKLNLGNAGYYRVEYDRDTHTTLAKAVGAMQPADRINLLEDTWALVEAGRKPLSAYAEIVDNLADDDDSALWEKTIRVVRRIDRLNQGRPERGVFQAFALSKLRPIFEHLGWEGAVDEDVGRAKLRSVLIRTLGDFGDEAIMAEAKRRFAMFVNNPAALSADLHDAVLHLAGRSADRATHAKLLALARRAKSKDERNRYYSAAGSALDPVLAKEALASALRDKMPGSTIGNLVDAVAAEHRDLAWGFVRANFSVLAARQGSDFSNEILPNLMSQFTERTHAAEFTKLVSAQSSTRTRRAVARAQERIGVNAEIVKSLPTLDEWLARRPH